MSCSATPVWKRGETREMTLTVFDAAGGARDIGAALALEYQVKAAPGAADPPLISLSLGSGVTIRSPQTGQDEGRADVVASSAQTDLLGAGTYYEEAVLVMPGTPPIRKYILGPRKIIVVEVVNRP